jgi:hypothetical protein
MELRKISNEEFTMIVSSWWRNKDFRKLKLLKRIETLYKSKRQRITNADLIQRVRDLDSAKRR